MKLPLRPYAKIFAALLSLCALGGCATYSEDTQGMRAAWYGGDVNGAAARAEAGLESSKGGADELVWTLEAGATARAGGGLAKSAELLESAESIVARYEAEPEPDVLAELKSLAINQSYLPYRGYNYDKIMSAAYRAMNFIELADHDSARRELMALMDYQQKAERDNAERIRKEARRLHDAQYENNQKTYDAQKTLADAHTAAQLEKLYGENFLNPSADPEMRAKAVYVNPFAYWLIGAYFSATANSSADREIAATAMRLAHESAGRRNAFLAEDAKISDELATKGRAMDGVVYVVYEAGSAPVRSQFAISLPLFIFSRDIPTVAVNFPYLVPQDSFVPSISVIADGREAQTSLVADIDEIVSREFKNRLPVMLFRTVLSAAVKAGAQYAVQSASRDNDAAFWATVVVGSIYQSATNKADQRTWTTLPKQISIARVPAPADGKLLVDGIPVFVSSKGVSLVFAKKTSATAPTILRGVSITKESK